LDKVLSIQCPEDLLKEESRRKETVQRVLRVLGEEQQLEKSAPIAIN
jgi:hypothetical protein